MAGPTGSITISFSNWLKAGIYVLWLVQDGNGSRVPTLSGVTYPNNNTTPTWTTVANRQDIITLYYDSTTVFASCASPRVPSGSGCLGLLQREHDLCQRR
jgi:hypothetical protein